jgi:hypothetical protein
MLCSVSQCIVRKLQRQIPLLDSDDDYVCSTCSACRFSICDICPAGYTRWFLDRRESSKTPIRLLEFRHNSWWGENSLCRKQRDRFVSDLATWLDQKAIQLVFVQNSDVWDDLILKSITVTKTQRIGFVYLKEVHFETKRKFFFAFQDAYKGFHLTFDHCTLNETFCLALLQFATPLRVRFVRCSFQTPLSKHIRIYEHSVSRKNKQHNRTWISSVAKYLRFPNTLLILMLSYVFYNFRSLRRPRRPRRVRHAPKETHFELLCCESTPEAEKLSLSFSRKGKAKRFFTQECGIDENPHPSSLHFHFLKP